ncbi:MAG: hypothetical protein ACRC33_28060 [Gemmataceae bacterium]
MPSTKADALTKVTEFEARSGGTDWIHVKKEDLVTGLKDRLATPNNVNTSAVNLCGPGAFFRCLAMDDPVAYASAVISLWESNAALIGTRKFKASHKVRIAAPGTTAAVDWVPMASLRDDENTLISYDSSEGGLSGLTMPSGLAKWFKEAGYADVTNVTNVLFTKGMDCLTKAESLRMAGQRVCLLINSDMLKSAKQDNKSLFPDHWVVLAQPASLNSDGTVKLKVFSWGKLMPVPADGGTMPAGMFLKNYYGYVAAKPA